LRSANIDFNSIELDKMGKRKQKQRFFYLIKNFSLAEGEEIEQELINKTKQETVPNIFIKQQHIGLL
jgi:glutaredoxin